MINIIQLLSSSINLNSKNYRKAWMELTQENLKKGLDMVGKGLLSTPEWNGKFA